MQGVEHLEVRTKDVSFRHCREELAAAQKVPSPEGIF